jgi:uncharacterized membrane protein YfcA
VSAGELVIVAVAGFVASLVDGALGMGFGPTSSSILLNTGLSPAGVSTTVNLAKVATGIAAAISHWRFRNIDHRLVLQLAIPGCVGALIGVTVLSNVDGDDLKPVLAVMLLLIGLRILWRFRRGPAGSPAEADDFAHDPDRMPEFNQRGVEVAATAGGVTNGLIGAWGPIVTPFLLHRGLTPRFAVGSVNTAEVAVATVSAGTIIASLGADSVELGVVVAMLLGGVLAAPLAAFVVRYMPARAIGLAVGALLLLTNARDLAGFAELGALRWLAYAAVVALVALAILTPQLDARRAGIGPEDDGPVAL